MSQESFEKVLDKLADNFDDFKERLIRIEENVKDVKHVKNDVEQLKIKHADVDSKASSAHKRLDSVESNLIWITRTVIGGIVVGIIGLLFFVAQLFLKGGA